MSESQDIREWAKAQGIGIAVRGPIPADIRERWNERAIAEDDAVTPADADGSQPGPRPAPRKPWWKKPGAPPDNAPKSKRRVSIENVVSQAWGLGAMFLARNPRNLPVARVLDMQAPVAGVIVNDLAKGTILDKALQPIARAGVNGEKMMGLIGPPILVSAITSKPDLYPVLRPALKMAIMSWMEISEPAMKRAEKKAQDFADRFGNVDIDGMIDALFAPPPGWEPPSEDAVAEAA